LFGFYAAAHVVPIATGFLNWLVLKAFGRRLYRDHYGTDAELVPIEAAVIAKDPAL